MNEVQKAKNERAANARTFKELSGVEAMHLKKTNPSLYAELRDAAGVIPGYREPGLRISHRVETEEKQPLSDAEINLMLKYSKETCDKFFVSNGSKREPDLNFVLAKKIMPDGEIVARDANEVQEIRVAASLHGVIPSRVRLPAQEVAAPVKGEDDGRINVGKLGALAGLPEGYRVTHKQYNDLLAGDARRIAGRSAEQIAADRMVELKSEMDRVAKSLVPEKKS